MKISVIIPNYNGAEVLDKNISRVLESIEASDYDSEIIVTDDASTDNSLEVIKNLIDKHSPAKLKIKLLTSTENKGFSTNVNRGVGEADGELLLLLNTDVIPSKNFLDKLVRHFDDEKVFAVGCKDESVERGKIVLRGRGKGYWKRGFLVHSAASMDGSSTLWVSGGSGAFRKNIWDKLGGLDPLYDPFYWEDIDLSYRALKSGYKIIFDKESTVRHEHEKGVIKKSFNSNKVKKIAYRNQFIFAWKNSDWNNLIKGILWLPYHLINAIISGDMELVLGFFDALKKLPKIFKSRKEAGKLFIKSDKEVVTLS